MKIPVESGRLIGGVSQQVDEYDLANEQRRLTNQQVNAWVLAFPTTDATLTAAWSDAMPPNSVGDFTFTAVGVVAGGAALAGYRRRVVVQRVGTGAVTYVGAGADIIGVDKETDPTWDAAFALDATLPGLLFVAVQGAAATEITWRIHIEGTVSPWL